MKWSKMRDGLAATGSDGTIYRLRRDPLRIEGTTPDGEVIEPLAGNVIPWRDEGEAKWWAEENNLWRAQ